MNTKISNMPYPSASSGLKYWATSLDQPEEAIVNMVRLQPLQRSEMVSLFKQNVSIINIETSSACNRVCTYCPDSTYDRKTQILMSDAIWDRILGNISEMKYQQQVSLNLYNEPMLDPTIYKKISDLKSASPHCITKISSNGDYLNEVTLSKLERAGLDLAYVTLHQPAGKPYKDNQQLEAFRKFFKRCNIPPTDLDIKPGLKINTEIMWGSMKIVLMSNNWGAFGNDRAGTVVELKKRELRSNPCMRVFREFTISHMGEVFPCCQFFPDAPSSKIHLIGKIEENDIWEIFSNKLSVSWRRSMFDFSPKKNPCDTCADPDNADPSTKNRRIEILNASRISD